jgi:hypothetical protein
MGHGIKVGDDGIEALGAVIVDKQQCGGRMLKHGMLLWPE